MDPVGAASGSIAHYQHVLDVANQRLSEGIITPEVVSAQALAETQLEAQTKIFKEALEAQTRILDLLV